MTKPLFILLITSLACLSQQPVTFTLLPAQTTSFTVAASGGGSDTSTVTYTGTMETSLSLDLSNLSVTNTSFTGGQLFLSDTNLSFNTTVSGFIPVAVTYSGTGMAGFWNTPAPPGTLTPGGVLNNLEHTQTINQGSVMISANSFLGNQGQTTNFSTDPETAPIEGVNTISLTETSATLWERSVTATLTSNRSSTRVIPVDGTSESVTVTENGIIQAEASFTLPTEYGSWALANGLTTPLPSDLSPAGVPYAILFAFNLSATAPCLPIKAVSSSTVEVTLPTGGLKNALIPEYSEALSGWSPLPLSFWTQGANSFNKGATGIKILSFPSSSTGRGFIRFQTTL